MHFLKRPPSLQARGRPQEAKRELRAMLGLMRENRARMQDIAGMCQDMMHNACIELKVLDPGLGELDLIKSWAGERAQMRRG